MMRGSISMELDSIPTKGASERDHHRLRMETMRQRPVSQMFHAKSLEQFLGGVATDDENGGLPTPTSGSGVVTVRSPRDDGNKRLRERWSLRPSRSSGARSQTELRLSQSPPPDGSFGKDSSGGGPGPLSSGGGGSRVRGHTVSTPAAAAAPAPEADGKKKSGFKIGRMLGDMGKGMTNAMAAIPITPRSGGQKERERLLLLEQSAKQAEQAAAEDTTTTVNWEKKKKAATTTSAKGKMNALLHSIGSPGENISRHVRKRSVSGKLTDGDRSVDDSDAAEREGSLVEGEGGESGEEGKRSSGPGSRIGRAKSVSDLQKVSKTSPIKKRNSTFGSPAKGDTVKRTLSMSSEEDAQPSSDHSVYPVFGGTLEEVMALQKDLVDLGVPIVLVALTSALIKVGTDQEGLFRVPGNKMRVDKLKARIGEGDYEFDEERMSVHDIASTLKEWLQTLKQPIVPTSMYDRCVECASKPKECVTLVEDLPPLNRSVLKYIVSFLQTHVLRPEIQKVTRMDIKSLATTFAPCILRSPEVKDMQVMMANIQQEIKFLVNLLMLMNSAVVGDTTTTPPTPSGP